VRANFLAREAPVPGPTPAMIAKALDILVCLECMVVRLSSEASEARVEGGFGGLDQSDWFAASGKWSREIG
jgi:hypothetical protein